VLVTAGLDGLLIRNSRGGPVWLRTFHARSWRQATEAAGLPGVRFHDYADVGTSTICGTSMPAR
jgi:hypothetical protein